MNQWLSGLSVWIETLGLHRMMQTVEWAVPAVQVAHILAIAVVFSSSLVLALRATGLALVDLPAAQWGERFNGWIWAGIVALLVSGSLLIIGEPARSLLATAFQAKMVLLVVALGVFVALAQRLRRIASPDDTGPAERALAGLLILLWVAIIACGRWIAYA